MYIVSVLEGIETKTRIVDVLFSVWALSIVFTISFFPHPIPTDRKKVMKMIVIPSALDSLYSFTLYFETP